MKPTYEELEQEVARLRERVAPGADEEFTERVRTAMMRKSPIIQLRGFVAGDTITMTPADIWEEIMDWETPWTTRQTAKLGRSLLALGWVRSYKSGNLIYKIKVEDYLNV